MEFGKLTAVFDADVRKFDAGARSVQTKLNGLTKDLTRTVTSTNQLTGALDPANTRLLGMSSNLGAVAGITVIATTAVAGLVTGIFALTKSTAAFDAGFHDLSQQLGIGVAMLSTLKVAADTSGASFAGSTTALGKYLKSVSDANSGNEELRKKFIQVGFTQKDLTEAHKSSDAAIAILIDRVGELGNDQDRLNALQKVGVRNGQELNGIIKEMDGTFADFQKRVAAMGLVVTPEQAIAADKFDDSLKLLELTIKGLTYTFGREFIPAITSGMNEIQSGLQNNESWWSWWATRVREEIIGVRVAYAGLSAFLASGGGIAGGVPAAILAGATRNRELKSLAGMVVGGAGPVSSGRPMGTSGGGGGGGKSAAQREAEAAAKRQQQYITELQREVSKLADELTGVDISTREYAVQQEILNGLLEQAPPHMQKLALEVGRTHDEIAKINRLTKQFNDFVKEQTKQLASLRPGMNTYLGQATALVDSLERQNVALDATKRFWMLFDASIIQVSEDAERLNQILDNLPDNIGLFTVPEFDPEALGRKIEEAIGPPPPDPAEEMKRIREQMEDLAADLTSLIDRSIFDGFEGGMKRGFATLTLGILDIVRNIFLKQLESALTEALIGLRTGGSGGSWVSKLLGIGIPAVLGGIGGGVGGGKGGIIPGAGGKAFASGGYLGPGQWGIAGDRGPEPIYGGRTGMTVFPNKSNQVTHVTNNISVTAPLSRGASFKQQRTKREIAERVAAILAT